ncbi:M24 family metallopeptidase [Eilatimonas milleporae]|uniref:Xaa-Pro aminopeptidase n=1 Tax=Eilatimonas milleporae TaxID=911205 RepID=A0A3M0CRG2_9PROT|nr:M24 family metallopeptidase [Eilatimonas milleporae]RMB12072.1 Xaa-Pro aminopeptidase [Eilatimonas milleporae]
MRLSPCVVVLLVGVSAAFGACLPGSALAQGETGDPAMPAILDLRAQAKVRDAWLAHRLETVVPALMRREGIDMWILIAREYNEDPVVETMLPATWLAARRRTVLMFFDPGDGQPVEKLSVSRYAVGTAFEAAWNPEAEPDQWARIRALVAERDPKRIAVNRSATFALADGLSASEADGLTDALGATYASRLVSGENLAIGWLETRTAAELEVYPTIVRIAHAIIAEGFSERVITPGLTTSEDVVWWYRERIRALGLETWFHPSVRIQRAANPTKNMTTMFSKMKPDTVIRPGDLLHVDLGITYLGLNTDTQHHAYVLRPGETDAPDGLKAGLAAGNRVQDILMESYRAGDSGNDLLAAARAKTTAEGLAATIYSHPIGYHGHGAGPWVGMWDNQDGTPGKGDYPLYPDTAWSIELNVEKAVPEWDGQSVRFMLEEDAWFDGKTVRFLDGRQERFHLIPRP